MQVFYIKGINNETIVKTMNSVSKLQVKALTYIEKECNKYLSTLEGRIKAVKTEFKYVRLTPIYVNENTILIYFASLNNKDILLINALAIKRIIKDHNKTIVYFSTEEALELDVKIQLVNLSFKKALSLEEYMQQ